jgi:exopolysaccharide biosynthesis polyprenyl glycosylphosphotransferase
MAVSRTAMIVGIPSTWLIAGIAMLFAPEVALAAAAVTGIVDLAVLAPLVKRRMGPSVRVALIGSPTAAHALERELRAARLRCHQLVGWIGAPTHGDGDARRLGSVAELHALVDGHRIELILLSSGVPRMVVFEELDRSCQYDRVHLCELAEFYEEHFGHIPIAEINAAWFQCVLHPRHSTRFSAAKRVFDLAIGAVIALLALPILVVLTVLIRLDGGPALYRQRRVGERGRTFTMLKLRSMRPNGDAEAPWCLPDDDRVTAIGRFVRRTHLDELPQLLNVLRGDMTLVGPRPEQPHYVAQLERDIPHYNRRHLLRPGLTGWAQIRCGYAATEHESLWKLSHDLYYLKNFSPWLDVKILLGTLLLPFSRPRPDEPARPFVSGMPSEEPLPEPAVMASQV